MGDTSESLHVLLLSVHLGVTSKQTEGTCLHQLWQELLCMDSKGAIYFLSQV